MEIFDGIEAILTIVSELLYNKAFDKNKKLLKRLPYIMIYVLILLLIIVGTIYLGITLINSNQKIFGYLSIVIAVLSIFLLVFPFVKKINNIKIFLIKH